MPEATQCETVLAHRALTYLDGLYGYAMMLCHSPAQAEDLVQETYLRGVRSLHRLTADSNLKAWLFTILRNTWLNQRRHDQCGPPMVDLGEEDGPFIREPVTSDRDPYSIYQSQAECTAVRAAVNQLPQLYRDVIVLREFEGLSYHEIGTVLGVPDGTVMSRLGRARDRLREMLSHWKSTGAVGGA